MRAAARHPVGYTGATMIDLLAILSPALFLLCAPLLLVTRFLRPKLMSWWLLVACASCLGWVLLVVSEHFRAVGYDQCVERRFEEGLADDPECPFLFVDGVYSYNLELGWLWSLLYLTPWLGLYAIAHSIRRHTRRI